jgi:ATP-dependent DNA ligase
MRRFGIRVTYMVFDLLSLDGEDLTCAPYSERRARLEALDLNGAYWQTPETFEDREPLFQAVCEHELEGVVAKRKGSRYRPGERGWTKTKNKGYWRDTRWSASRPLTSHASECSSSSGSVSRNENAPSFVLLLSRGGREA